MNDDDIIVPDYTARIAKLREELACYEDSWHHLERGPDGTWIDVTPALIAKVQQDIARYEAVRRFFERRRA